MTKLLEYLRALGDLAFYGSVTVHFRDGKVTKVETRADYLVETLPVPSGGQGVNA